MYGLKPLTVGAMSIQNFLENIGLLHAVSCAISYRGSQNIYFFHFQETVVCLQALSTYMKMTAPIGVDLFISLSGYDWDGGRFSIANETVNVLQIAENVS
jgi:hypothetical protein